MKCLECERKIGWTKKPVEGLYCSESCRDEANAATERQRVADAARFAAASVVRESELHAGERERLEIEAALLRGTSDVVLRPNLSQSPCPKCGAPWNHAQGGGALGRNRGECGHCGFRADFVAIESCPHCRCFSLVVESEHDARCPRCKSRPRRGRQIA
jgi:hypothetical protein